MGENKNLTSKVFEISTGRAFNAWLQETFIDVVSHMHHQELEDFLNHNPNLRRAVK